MRWLCIYCNEVFEVCHVPADLKDEAEKKRTTQDWKEASTLLSDPGTRP